MIGIENIIKKPLLTERATLETENFNRYGFIVDLKANKHQIKSAVEQLFDVKVKKIWTSVSAGKVKRYGRFTSKSSSVKKAYVQIEQGQKIEFFKGV